MQSAAAEMPQTVNAPGIAPAPGAAPAAAPVQQPPGALQPQQVQAAAAQASPVATPQPQAQAQPAAPPAGALSDGQIAQLLAVLRLLPGEQVARLLSALDQRVLKAALFQLNLQNPDLFPKPTPPAGPRAQFGVQGPSERELGAGERKKTQAKAIADAIAEAEANGLEAPTDLPQVDPVLTENHSLRPEGGAAPQPKKKKSAEPSAEDGYSRRISPRKPASNNGRIVGTTDRRGINCEILDISETGALIRVAGDVSLSERFFLYDFGNREASDMVAKMPRRSCLIVWRKRNKMGVKFVE